MPQGLQGLPQAEGRCGAIDAAHCPGPPGRLSALRVSHRQLVSFVWAGRALNSPKTAVYGPGRRPRPRRRRPSARRPPPRRSGPASPSPRAAARCAARARAMRRHHPPRSSGRRRRRRRSRGRRSPRRRRRRRRRGRWWASRSTSSRARKPLPRCDAFGVLGANPPAKIGAFRPSSLKTVITPPNVSC